MTAFAKAAAQTYLILRRIELDHQAPSCPRFTCGAAVAGPPARMRLVEALNPAEWDCPRCGLRWVHEPEALRRK
jgi:hypothetical protein